MSIHGFKRKNRTSGITAVALAAVIAMPLFLPAAAYASGLREEETTAGETTETRDDEGNAGGGGNVSSDTGTAGSGGSANSGSEVHYTDEEIQAMADKSAVVSQLSGYASRIKQGMATQDGRAVMYGAGEDATRISNIGYLDVPMDEFLSMLDKAYEINSLIDQSDRIYPSIQSGSGGETWRLDDVEYSAADAQTFYQIDGSGNAYAVQSGTDTEYDGSGSLWQMTEDGLGDANPFAINLSLGELSDLDLMNSGLSHYVTDYMTGLAGKAIVWDPSDGMYSMSGDRSTLSSFARSHLPQTFRSDLIYGGLHDSGNWLSRFLPYETLRSNAMTDAVTLALIDEYAITSVRTDDIDITSYHGDERMWTVSDYGTGEVLGTAVTENAEHALRGSYPEGDYLITPYQLADYTAGTYVTYVENEYLIDALTGNVLWYSERATENTVCLSSTAYTACVPSGTPVLLHVDALGNITGDDGTNYGIERVE